jgi:radical SAM enzyme (TIGR01210 family)
MTNNNLMNKIGYLAQQGRPLLPENLNVTLVRESPTFARLWIKTIGCRHSKNNGGCIPCDYWTGSKIEPEILLPEIISNLESLSKCPPRLLLLNTNGSVLDNFELSKDFRQKIFSLIAERLPNTKIIIETRVETITMDSLSELSVFKNENVAVEFGVESSSQVVNTLCCNKGLDLSQISYVVKLCIDNGYDIFANVLVGLPFLNYNEIIQDAIDTIHWCISNGVSSCVVFPVNIKPWTILHWLNKNGFYSPVSLWALVEVLVLIDLSLLKNIEISWYPLLEQNLHPLYATPTIIPETCSKCNDKINILLQRYARESNQRHAIIKTLKNIECDCRRPFSNNPLIEAFPSQRVRKIKTQYEKISEKAFGIKWRVKHEKNLNRFFNKMENNQLC